MKGSVPTLDFFGCPNAVKAWLRYIGQDVRIVDGRFRHHREVDHHGVAFARVDNPQHAGEARGAAESSSTRSSRLLQSVPSAIYAQNDCGSVVAHVAVAAYAECCFISKPPDRNRVRKRFSRFLPSQNPLWPHRSLDSSKSLGYRPNGCREQCPLQADLEPRPRQNRRLGIATSSSQTSD